jgi:hypothetical protein
MGAGPDPAGECSLPQLLQLQGAPVGGTATAGGLSIGRLSAVAAHAQAARAHAHAAFAAAVRATTAAAAAGEEEREGEAGQATHGEDSPLCCALQQALQDGWLLLPLAPAAVSEAMCDATLPCGSGAAISRVRALLVSVLLPAVACAEFTAKAALCCCGESPPPASVAPSGAAAGLCHLPELSQLLRAAASPSAEAPLSPDHLAHLAEVAHATAAGIAPALPPASRAALAAEATALASAAVVAALEAHTSLRYSRRLRAELQAALLAPADSAGAASPPAASVDAGCSSGARAAAGAALPSRQLAAAASQLESEASVVHYSACAGLCRQLLHLAPTRSDCLPVLDRIAALVQGSLTSLAAVTAGASPSASPASSASSSSSSAHPWAGAAAGGSSGGSVIAGQLERSTYPLDELDYAGSLAWNHGVQLYRLQLWERAERFLAWTTKLLPAMRALSCAAQGAAAGLPDARSAGGQGAAGGSAAAAAHLQSAALSWAGEAAPAGSGMAAQLEALLAGSGSATGRGSAPLSAAGFGAASAAACAATTCVCLAAAEHLTQQHAHLRALRQQLEQHRRADVAGKAAAAQGIASGVAPVTRATSGSAGAVPHATAATIAATAVVTAVSAPPLAPRVQEGAPLPPAPKAIGPFDAAEVTSSSVRSAGATAAHGFSSAADPSSAGQPSVDAIPTAGNQAAAASGSVCVQVQAASGGGAAVGGGHCVAAQMAWGGAGCAGAESGMAVDAGSSEPVVGSERAVIAAAFARAKDIAHSASHAQEDRPAPALPSPAATALSAASDAATCPSAAPIANVELPQQQQQHADAAGSHLSAGLMTAAPSPLPAGLGSWGMTARMDAAAGGRVAETMQQDGDSDGTFDLAHEVEASRVAFLGTCAPSEGSKPGPAAAGCVSMQMDKQETGSCGEEL